VLQPREKSLPALTFLVAVLATELIQTVAIAIVYVICVALMLVPVVAFVVLAFVTARASRAERRNHDVKVTPGFEVATQGGTR
jgi:preprotein translocase subunit YajC